MVNMYETKQDSSVKPPTRSQAQTLETTGKKQFMPPRLRKPHPLLQMQQRYGNHHVQRMIETSRTEGSAANAQSSTVAIVQRQSKMPKCSQAEITKLNLQMHVYCNKPRSCSIQGDSCATATSKVAAGNGCVDERTKLQQKCFSPGDPDYEDHMLQIAQASAALRNCIAVMTAKCALEAAALAALAAAALALKNAAKQGMKRIAAKAFIYAEVAAAVLLLASGKAEAKISLEGDSPLEALFKAMEQDGVAVPDDLKKMIESDPELKKMLGESAKKGGSLSDVQKEIARKYSEYILQYMDEFTKEELQTIMTTTDQIADKMPTDVKVEDIKKLLKEKVDEKGGQKQEGDKENTPPAAKSKNTVDTQSAKYERLDDENKRKIKDAPPSVVKVFQEFVSGKKGDLKLDDITVKKFFEIVPVDLTNQQAEALISYLTSSQGQTIDAVLESLKKGVEEVRKNTELKNDGIATGTSTEGDEQPAKSQEQIISELKEIAKKHDFSKVSEGSFSIQDIFKKIANNKITTQVYGKIKGIGVVGYISGTIPAIDIEKLKVGDSVAVTITSQSPFVDKNGKVYKLELGKSINIVK